MKEELWYTEEELKESIEYDEEIPKELLPLKLVAGQCDAECRTPATRGGKIWCVRTPACANAGGSCHCVLYRLKKNWVPDDDDPPWERLPSRRKHPHEPATYFYRCWCVV